MTTADKRKLSVKEKVDYVPALLSIGGTALAASVTGLFRGANGADTYRHHVTHAIIRKFNSRLNSIQSQCIQPTFEEIYEKWCKSNDQKPDIATIRPGLKGLWVGDKSKAKHVVVYFHGGGFALDGSEGHVNFWGKIQSYLKQNSVDVAFFFVVYTLSTEALYPTQLEESVAAVQYLIEQCNRRPSELILAGDSAGGNLAVAVLLHLSQPCGEIESNFTVTENLKALMLMAPWVSFETSWPSFELNKNKDYIEAAVESRWSAEYIGAKPKPRAASRDVKTGNPDTHPNSPYAEPALAPSEAWKDAKCDKILVVYGSIEVLTGGIEEWVAKYKDGIGEERVQNQAIEVHVGKNESHIAPLVWPLFGDKKQTESETSIKKFMIENLS